MIIVDNLFFGLARPVIVTYLVITYSMSVCDSGVKFRRAIFMLPSLQLALHYKAQPLITLMDRDADLPIYTVCEE